jgi:hypothetical protein
MADLRTHASGVEVSADPAQYSFRGNPSRRLAQDVLQPLCRGSRTVWTGRPAQRVEWCCPPAGSVYPPHCGRTSWWWLPQRIPHPVFAALREGDPCLHRSGLLVSRHPSRVPSELVSGIRLTAPAETLLAAARDLGVLDLVLMGDSALRLGHCTIDQLVETAPGPDPRPARFGFTKAQLLNEGATIIASTDTLLGRSWDPARLRRWNALVADSLFGHPGRARALRHWRAAR